MKADVLFLVKDYYHNCFDYSKYNNKENIFKQAVLEGFNVYVSSWNNLILKKSKFYLKRGLKIKEKGKEDIKVMIEIDPVLINYHVNPIGDKIIVNKYNLHNINFAIKKGIISDTYISDFKLTRKLINYYIQKGFYKGKYNILEPYIYMGKRHTERSFLEYEKTGQRIKRPEGFVGNKQYLIQELKFLYNSGKLKATILKPNTGTRSEGIILVHKDNFDNVIATLEKENEKWYVAQELILDDLFLYDDKKMTIRLYAFLSSLDPIKFQIYKGGYCYPNKNKYEKDLEDNYSIFLYDKNEPSISLDKYLQHHNIDKNQFFNEFKEEVRKSFQASKLYYKIEEYKYARNQTIMLFGFDYLLTKDGLQFIELNWFPNFEKTTENENKIKMDVLRKYFKLVKKLT